MTQQPTTTLEKAAFDRRNSLGHQVNYVARLFAQSIRTRIEPLGVVPGQLAQLLALYEQDGVTQTELCERVRIDPSTMAHTLKRMERDGLVTRKLDSTDRRRAQVLLTPRAVELRREVENAAEEVNAIALQGVDRESVEQLLGTLATLITNLEADQGVSKNQ